MNKYWIALVLYTVWFIKPTPIAPVTLKVINRSGMEIALQLDGAVLGESYYFKVPKGDRQLATEVRYSVQRDDYSLQLYFLENYDPVYGTKCSESSTIWYPLQSQRTITILPCDELMPNNGEQTFKKIGGEAPAKGGGGSAP